MSSNIVINILTRTGRRKNYYNILEKSILDQVYSDDISVRHIKSVDNPNCDFLDCKNSFVNNVIPVIPDKNSGEVFYNKYLNVLASKVNSGWVIILDDDSQIINNHFIQVLSDECRKSKENEILIYQNYIYPRKIVVPRKIDKSKNRIVRGGVDMSCFCVHYTIFKKIKFDSRIMGDYNFLEKALNSKQYKIKYLNIPKCVWANYKGPKHGN